MSNYGHMHKAALDVVTACRDGCVYVHALYFRAHLEDLGVSTTHTCCHGNEVYINHYK